MTPDLYKLRNRTKNLIFYPSYINNNSLENVPYLINGMPSVLVLLTKDFLVSLDSNLSNKKNMFVNKVTSLILPICPVPVEVGRFLARHVFFSVILSMRGAKFQFLLRWSKLRCCRWLNKSCFWLEENGQKNCRWSFPSRMLPLRVFLAPLWCRCCFWSVTINQKPAGPPTLMGWKIWKKQFTACWSGVAVTLNPVTKCPTMMHLKQMATPVRKKSERLLTRAWLDLTRVSHLQQKIMGLEKSFSSINFRWKWLTLVLCTYLTLFSKTSSFLLLTHYFFFF